MAAAITTAFAGCGTDHHTTVLSPGFLLPADVARYSEGSPARAAVQLLQSLEYNDPVAAVSFFVPAWRFTSSELAALIRGPFRGAEATAGHSSRILTQIRSGRRATLVVTIHRFKLILEFEEVGSRWELGSLRIGALVLAPGAAHLLTPIR